MLGEYLQLLVVYFAACFVHSFSTTSRLFCVSSSAMICSPTVSNAKSKGSFGFIFSRCSLPCHQSNMLLIQQWLHLLRHRKIFLPKVSEFFPFYCFCRQKYTFIIKVQFYLDRNHPITYKLAYTTMTFQKKIVTSQSIIYYQ